MNKYNKIKSLAAALLLPAVGFCQEQSATSNSTYFSNMLFITLVVTIVLLAVVIVAFAGVFKNIADSNFLINKYANKKDDQPSSIKNFTTVVLLLVTSSMVAQDKIMAVKKDDGLIGGIDQFTFYFLIFIVFLELLILGLMFYQFNFLTRTQLASSKETAKKLESKLLLSLTDAVAIEEENSILLDHDYDGIKELDNNLPPWWKYGFYLTIVVAFGYMINYHVLGTGDLQTKEYEKEIAQAKLDVDAYMKTSANNVDENTVKLLTEASDLAAGKDVFVSTCAACHGKLGEGSVGPNLTDDYWVHGGSVQALFKTIKYGWVEKGMKSWKEDLSPMQIAQITSYIKSIKGTNPPNSKAPQGDLYTDSSATLVSDSIAVKNDSLLIQLKTDSISVGQK